MKPALLLTLAVLIHFSAYAGPEFPALNAEDLRDNKLQLPSACEGKAAMVLVSFSKPEEGEIESWIRPFRETFPEDPDAVYYTVAMLEGVPGFVIFFIKNGMRSAPESEHGSILISYDNRNAFMQKLGVTDDGMHSIYLLDKKGRVAASFRGKKASEKDMAELIKAYKKIYSEKITKKGE